MFQNLEIFQMAYSMATHAGQRQSVAARNMAHADTPGFKAQDIKPFRDTWQQGQSGTAQRATRAAHFNGDMVNSNAALHATLIEDTSVSTDPNGNSVSVESEILRSVEAKRQHDRALAIYRSSLNVLRSAIGK